MSKQHNIRWGRSDYSRLSHLIRKVNKKAFELEVTRPDLAGHIPNRLEYQDVKASIKTRQDFNRFMKKYGRYLREGSEELVKSSRGAVASKWEVNEFKIAQRAENIRRANERKRIAKEEATIAGKSTGVKKAEMGRIKDVSLNPSKKKFDNMSQKEWEKAFKMFDDKMNQTSRDEELFHHMRNYIKGLIAEGYSDELIDIVQKVPLDTFKRVFHRDETATYDFIYDPLELKMKDDTLKELWSQYADENTTNGIDIYNINKEVENEYQNGERIRGQGRVYSKKV